MNSSFRWFCNWDEKRQKVVVKKVEFLERKGSWTTIKTADGQTKKINGLIGFDSVRNAICGFILLETLSRNQLEVEKKIESAIEEAMEWGRLLGNLEGAIKREGTKSSS